MNGKKKSVDCAWLKTKGKNEFAAVGPIRYQRLLNRHLEKGGSAVRSWVHGLKPREKSNAPEKEEKKRAEAAIEISQPGGSNGGRGKPESHLDQGRCHQ